MKKRMLIAGILCTMMLALAGAKGKKELSDAGKSGAITVKIGSHLTVTSIDDQPTKLKGKIMLEAGEHVIEFKYYHVTSSYVAQGSARRSFNFEEGKKYVYKAIENLENHGSLYVTLHDESLPTIEDKFFTVKKIDDPETYDGVNIEILKSIPEGKKFKYVANIKYDFGGGPIAGKTITLERAVLYYKEFLYKNGIDAVIETAINNCGVHPGFTFYGIGIKYIDEEEAVEEK
ncbi:MAG: hypothetical protein KBS84_00745 [Treponema sp.]|nr:hypothetical protein [Candidatus Treponema scatequi]